MVQSYMARALVPQALLREAFSRLHQVKVNYSSIGLSAMEDFIGRGDRRIAKVSVRAWILLV